MENDPELRSLHERITKRLIENPKQFELLLERLKDPDLVDEHDIEEEDPVR